ncbi:MAG: TRAP transporter small permease subunit [Alphaproteobacteria bacterium]
MTLVARLVLAISAFNTALGRALCWLTLGIVLVCFLVVVLRYVFSIGFVWLQDLYVWLNGIMFTGVAAFTLLRDGHVRVDIFYRKATVRSRAWVDLIGTLVFLFPFTVSVVIWSWPYVARSWRFMESSSNIGGMPGLFVLKSFILVFAGLVMLQGVAMALRAVLELARHSHLLPSHLRYSEDR